MAGDGRAKSSTSASLRRSTARPAASCVDGPFIALAHPPVAATSGGEPSMPMRPWAVRIRVAAVVLTLRQQRPDDACRSVRLRDCRDHGRAAPEELRKPTLTCLDTGLAYRRRRLGAPVAVANLGDTALARLAPGALLLRHEANPGCEAPRRREGRTCPTLATISDAVIGQMRGTAARRRLGFAVLVSGDDRRLDLLDPRRESLRLRRRASQRLPRQRRQRRPRPCRAGPPAGPGRGSCLVAPWAGSGWSAQDVEGALSGQAGVARCQASIVSDRVGSSLASTRALSSSWWPSRT